MKVTPTRDQLFDMLSRMSSVQDQMHLIALACKADITLILDPRCDAWLQEHSDFVAAWAIKGLDAAELPDGNAAPKGE